MPPHTGAGGPRLPFTGWLLFLLELPLGGMILLMVRTPAGPVYPGSVIYLSALYAFYAMTAAICSVLRSRRSAGPILAAARALDLVSAMMALLGLQTAMISRFSPESPAFRSRMNALTGGFVWLSVIALALWLLLKRSRKEGRSHGSLEK